MAKYLITLKPIGNYFFGQETAQVLGNKQLYYQHSADYPQQTTLLGMLRFQLLKQENLIPLHENGNSKKAEKLIGKRSFTIDSSDAEKSFGIIKTLSPLALLKSEDVVNPYFLFDKEVVKTSDKEPPISIKLIYSDSSVIYGHNIGDKKAPLLKLDGGETYLAKYPFVSIYKSLNNSDEHVKQSEIFESKSQIGIEKAPNGQTKDEAFFKMEYKSLSKDWCFAFVAETENEELLESNDFAILGKEQSVFKLKIEKVAEDNPFSASLKKHSEYKGGEVKLTFLSDTFIEDEKAFYDNCLFANIDTIHFRNLTSIVSDKNKNYANKPEKSLRYNLIKRGSVVYTNQAENLIKQITEGKQSKQFHTIGYNNFIIETIKHK